ncbi:MAG: CHAT domain-containing protein [Limnothrix sp. BL-A-16]
MNQSWSRRSLLGLLGWGGAIALSGLGERAQAQALDDLLAAGRQAYHEGRYREAIALWQSVLEPATQRDDRETIGLVASYLTWAHLQLSEMTAAQAWIDRGRSALAGGLSAAVAARLWGAAGATAALQQQWSVAEQAFQMAAQQYQAASDSVGTLNSQIDEAAVWQGAGNQRRALERLWDLQHHWQQEPPQEPEAIAVRARGLHRLALALLWAEDFEQAWQAAIEAKPVLGAAAELTLAQIASWRAAMDGSAAEQASWAETAIEHYHAVILGPDPALWRSAMVGRLELATERGRPESSEWAEQLRLVAQRWTGGRSAVALQLAAARALSQLNQPMPMAQVLSLVQRAQQQAESLGDRALLGWAWQLRGQVLAQGSDRAGAAQAARSALGQWEPLDRPEWNYEALWLWGRMAHHLGQAREALAAYRLAAEAAQAARSSLAGLSVRLPGLQTEGVQGWLDRAEPLYRQQMGLLFGSAETNHWIEASEQLQNLQLQRIENFLQCRLDNPAPSNLLQLADSTTDERTAVVVVAITELPPDLASGSANRLIDTLVRWKDPQTGQERQNLHRQPIARSELETIVKRLTRHFRQVGRARALQQDSQQLYRWILEPHRPILTAADINLLVCVLDPSLRNLPIDALFDGERYLVESFAVAIAPDVKLDPASDRGRRGPALWAGLSEPREGFAALAPVPQQLAQLGKLLKGQVLLNQQFTPRALTQALVSQPITVLHLATHGQFSSQRDDTFLLTWEGKLNTEDLDQLLKERWAKRSEPLDLLTLSACQTATGDRYEALGLAGLAVRSGARSLVSSLWNIPADDTANQFFSQFYRGWLAGLSKARALQQAKLKLLSDQGNLAADPYSWAGFVLIGDWR